MCVQMTGTTAAKLIWEKTGKKGIEGMMLQRGKGWRPEVVVIHSTWKSEELLGETGLLSIMIKDRQGKGYPVSTLNRY